MLEEIHNKYSHKVMVDSKTPRCKQVMKNLHEHLAEKGPAAKIQLDKRKNKLEKPSLVNDVV